LRQTDLTGIAAVNSQLNAKEVTAANGTTERKEKDEEEEEKKKAETGNRGSH